MNELPVASCQLPARRRLPFRQLATGNWQHLVALLLLFAAPVLQACPVCFGGDPNSAMVKSTNNGVLFMLGVIGFVQLGFISLFITFWRRSRALRRRRESFRVLDGGAQ